jgi:SAM-dependent methyltransferase
MVIMGEDPLANDYYGIDAAVVFRSFKIRPNVTKFITGILSLTYDALLGFAGYRFLTQYLGALGTIGKSDDVESIKHKILASRDAFSAMGLYSYYVNTYREYNLLASLSLIDPRYIRGKVIDVGADDNAMAHVLTSRFGNVEFVLGTDVRACVNGTSEHSRIGFVTQHNDCELPARESSFDVAICRYSLHHMGIDEQLCILAEINRVLVDDGVLIIFENSFSRRVQPLNIGKYSNSLHSQFQELNGNEVQLAMSLLDIFSLGIKNKDQHFPFTFRSVEEWISILGINYSLESVLYYGLPMLDLHQQPLAVFILKNKKRLNPANDAEGL